MTDSMTAPTLRPCEQHQCDGSGVVTINVGAWNTRYSFRVACACTLANRAPAAPTGEAGRDPFVGSNPYERTVNKPAPADERARFEAFMQKFEEWNSSTIPGSTAGLRGGVAELIHYERMRSWRGAWQAAAQTRAGGEKNDADV